MGNIKYITLVYIFLNSFHIGYAQYVSKSPVIEFDTITNDVKSSFPFDQPFPLNITYKGKDKPVELSIFELDKFNRVKRNTLREYLRIKLVDYNKPIRKEYYAYGTKRRIFQRQLFKNAERDRFKYKKDLKIYYRQMPSVYEPTARINTFSEPSHLNNRTSIAVKIPPLEPSSTYRFIMTKSDNQSLDEVFNLSLDVFDENNETAEEGYNKFKNKYTSNYQSFNEFSQMLLSSKIELDKSSEERYNSHFLLIASTNRILLTDANLATIPKISFNKLSKIVNQQSELNTWSIKQDSLIDIRGNKLIKDSLYVLYILNSDYKNNLKNIIKYDANNNRFVDKSRNLSDTVNINNLSVIPGIHKYNDYYLKPLYSNINKGVNSIKYYPPLTGPVSEFAIYNQILLRNSSYSPIFDDDLQDLLNYTILWNCKDTNFFCKSQNSFINIVTNCRDHNNDQDEGFWLNIFSGYLPIYAENIEKPISFSMFSERKNNLQNSIEKMKIFISFFDTYKRSRSKDKEYYKNTLDNIYKILEKLNVAINNIDKMIKSKEEFANNVSGKININTYQINNGTTDQQDFKTRNKLSIVPDFGLILLGSGGKHFTVTNILPYLGFNINFRQINKDIAFGKIPNRTLWHQLCFMAGITLSPLQIQGEREDLFSNKSLMTGLGFRFNNVVKLSVGGVWFKSISPNPLNSQKNLKFSPYAGISLDLDLKDLFGGLSKLFGE